MECEDAITQAGIDLTENKFLRKIIVSKSETSVRGKYQNFTSNSSWFPRDLNVVPYLLSISILDIENGYDGGLALKDLGDWGRATEIWFDPKQFFSPIKLENIVGLKIDSTRNPRKFSK